MSNGVSILCGDVVLSAKQDFVATCSDQESFFDPQEFKKDALDFPNYGNPCETYSVILDGTVEPFPEDPENKNTGLWSTQIAEFAFSFPQPIVLTMVSERKYTSRGITFTFDVYNDIYCNNLDIKWYSVENDIETLLSEKTFSPTSGQFFCENYVENYNKVVVTFYSMNLMYNRLKLRSIDYGEFITISGENLTNVVVLQEMNPISTELFTNTVDFTINTITEKNYTFAREQPVRLYFNDVLLQTTFITDYKRLSKNIWEVKSSDYINLLDNTTFYGDVYSKDIFLEELLSNILNTAGVPFEIDDSVPEILVSGHIPICSCRDALRQVLFAYQCVADTTHSDVLKIKKLDDTVKNNILLDNIFEGVTIDTVSPATSVEITCHTYSNAHESVTLYEVDANDNEDEIPYYNNLLLTFSEPVYRLEISGGTFALDDSGNPLCSANYAIINPVNDTGKCTLTGRKYTHTTDTLTQSDPTASPKAPKNIVSITDATMVSARVVRDVLKSCYNYFTDNEEITLKYNDTKFNVPGDVITTETEYLGDRTKRIINQKYSLTGGIIVKEVLLK